VQTPSAMPYPGNIVSARARHTMRTRGSEDRQPGDSACPLPLTRLCRGRHATAGVAIVAPAVCNVLGSDLAESSASAGMYADAVECIDAHGTMIHASG
jgi:hypothetical protein